LKLVYTFREQQLLYRVSDGIPIPGRDFSRPRLQRGKNAWKVIERRPEDNGHTAIMERRPARYPIAMTYTQSVHYQKILQERHSLDSTFCFRLFSPPKQPSRHLRHNDASSPLMSLFTPHPSLFSHSNACRPFIARSRVIRSMYFRSPPMGTP
jgi:hypothetical protein